MVSKILVVVVLIFVFLLSIGFFSGGNSGGAAS